MLLFSMTYILTLVFCVLYIQDVRNGGTNVYRKKLRGTRVLRLPGYYVPSNLSEFHSCFIHTIQILSHWFPRLVGS